MASEHSTTSSAEQAQSILDFGSILYSNGHITTQEYATLRAFHNTEIATPPTVGDKVLIKREHSATAAVSKVLNTPELLEIILQQLPHCDLLKHTRLTCKDFNAAIGSSPVIKKRTSFVINARETNHQRQLNVGIKNLYVARLSTLVTNEKCAAVH